MLSIGALSMLLIPVPASGADARVTRIVIASRQPIAGGASFGSVRPYEPQ